MSLNWKEINLILDELDLDGSQIQGVIQSAYDIMILRLHKKGESKQVLISLSSGACRIHETFRAAPKSDKPLRFAQFLSSKIVNGWITQIEQLGDDRIIKIIVKRPESFFNMYIRLWSNAANFIVTDEDGLILDVMRRQPKRGEITGGSYTPQISIQTDKPKREFEIRELPGEGSFNKKVDLFYSEQGSALSLESLREQAKGKYEGSIDKISAALDRLREKEISFANADRFKKYGDLILSNISIIKPTDKWLELDEEGTVFKIELEAHKSPAAIAQKYYEKYRKEKGALSEIQEEIAAGEQEIKALTEKLERLLGETNPLILAKLLKGAVSSAPATSQRQLSKKEKTRPGLTFKRGDWLIIVGRDAKENDELLRRHVKGNDMWLHARDYHGSYVFIKQRAGKTVPLEILLDAGNLAIFYSKGRNNGKGDLFYTQVKYLRRAKDGPKGLVIPTQEKNLSVKVEDARLRVLEGCRI